MTLEKTIDREVSGSGDSGQPAQVKPKSYWRQPNVLTGLVGGVIGYALGHWLGNAIAGSYQQVQGNGENNFALTLGYLIGTLGWLAGLGILNYPLAKIVGLRPEPKYDAERRLSRYFRYNLDHNVVGVQYLVAMLVYFFVAGLFALAVRSELL